MNKICSLVLFICLSLGCRLHSQEDSVIGFFRLANATGLSGTLHFFMDGEELNPDGYLSGETTGSLGVAVSVVKLKASHPLCDEAEYELTLEPGLQTAVIAYVERQVDEKTGEIKKRTLKFCTLDRKAEQSKKSATLLYASNHKSIEVGVNGKPFDVKSLNAESVELGKSASLVVNIAVGETQVGSLDIDRAGDYAVVIFDQEGGSQGCLTFYNTQH